MSGIKGWPSSQRISDGVSANDFVSTQPMTESRRALDTVARFAFRVDSDTIPRTAGAGTGDPEDKTLGFFVEDTATPARVGDFVRFETGNAQFLEIPIVHVETNGFRLGVRFDGVDLSPYTPVPTDTFYILRYVMQRTDDTGAQLVTLTPSPIAFVLDGVDTQVEQDTVVTGNSIPLPVALLDTSGVPQDPATEGTLTNIDALLGSIDSTQIQMLTDVQNILSAVQIPGQYHASYRVDYSATNVDNTTWTEIVASIPIFNTNRITLFDAGGFAMELGIGGAGSEVRLLLIPPGGFNGQIAIYIPSGSRLSVRAVGATLVDAGELVINLFR